MTKLFERVLSIAQESVDLAPEGMDIIIRGQSLTLTTPNGSMTVVVGSEKSPIPKRSRQEKDISIDLDFNEYDFMDILESAFNSGCDKIYIKAA